MAGKIKVPDDCCYKTYSVCESAVDSSNRVEEDGEIDGPAVFMCGKCKLPIGDSLSWAGSDDEQNQIMLKRKRLLRFFYCCCMLSAGYNLLCLGLIYTGFHNISLRSVRFNIK